MQYKEIKGDLISLALQGEFDVIAHGCNCFCKQASGLAPQMVRAFNTDTFILESPSKKGDIKKLGNIDFRLFFKEKDEYGGKWVLFPDEEEFITGDTLSVINAYTQYNYGKNHSDGDSNPLDYEALTLCMRKINHTFTGKHIGLPQIGSGLAGGDWNRIKNIIQEELKECKVTVVIYDKNV
jgi:O-acetyl-ADP-ribose deacetylase (regulator of RNase III)